ncbi:MAG: hypothetical protein KGL39_15115 [Patescibacteria group bacterium]|nr:hypothetical protein [Patescibacteria group bacterium]
MPVLPGNQIGEWTVTLLTKFLEDWFRNHPLPPIQQLQVDTLRVNDTLDVVKKVQFDALDLHVVGNAGEPAYTNTWTYYGAPYAKAAYLKNPTGFVRLLGVIKGGTVGSAAFQLPPGYRPAVAPGPFAVVSNGAFGRVDIGTDGTVTPQSPSSNASVSLENIVFQAA